MTSKTDSTLLIYSTEHILVKEYKAIAVGFAAHDFRLEWWGDSIRGTASAHQRRFRADRLAVLRKRSGRDAVLPVAADRCGQRRTPEAGVDLPHRQARVGGHAGGGRRRDVRDRSGWRICAGAGDRRVAVEARRVAGGAARAGVLARVGRHARARVRGQRTVSAGAGRDDGEARAGLRQRGPRRFEGRRARRFEGRPVRVAVAARGVRRYRDHGMQQRRRFAHRRRVRRHTRLGRENGQAAVDVSHRAASRRTGVGDVAARCLEESLGDQHAGASSRWM